MTFFCFVSGGNARTNDRLQTHAPRTPSRSGETGREVQDGNGKPQVSAGQGIRHVVADVQSRSREVASKSVLS